MDSRKIRYLNARALVAKAGGITAFADAIGKQQPQASSFAGENPIKGIGPKIARQIEVAFEKPPGWLDLPHPEEWDINVAESGFSGQEAAGSKTGRQEVPIVGRAQLGKDGYWFETDHPVGFGDGYIEWSTSDTKAYALEAYGDSMEPRIRHGEFVIIEPSTPYQFGDEVLVTTTETPPRQMVKILLYFKEDRYHFASVNGSHPEIRLGISEVEKIHFVAGIAKRRMRRER